MTDHAMANLPRVGELWMYHGTKTSSIDLIIAVSTLAVVAIIGATGVVWSCDTIVFDNLVVNNMYQRLA